MITFETHNQEAEEAFIKVLIQQQRICGIACVNPDAVYVVRILRIEGAWIKVINLSGDEFHLAFRDIKRINAIKTTAKVA